MAVEAFIFNVYSPTTGLPLTGAAASLSFLTYQDDLGSPVAHPTITEVGGGAYKFVPVFSPGRALCFVISTSNNPLYLAGSVRPEDFSSWANAPSPALIVFSVFDPATGNPKAGVVNTFSSYEDQNGVALAQPTITDIGGGLYKFLPSFANANEISFTISTGNNPLYIAGSTRVEDFSTSGFIASNAVGSPNTVTISFAAGFTVDALSPTVSNPASWSITGAPAVSVTGVALISNQIVLTTSVQSNGVNYTVNIPNGITANSGAFGLLGPFALSFTGAAGDPILVQAHSVDEHTVDIYFSFPPVAARALDITQYSVSPALTISSVQQMSPTWYRLTTGPQTINQSYTITWPLH